MARTLVAPEVFAELCAKNGITKNTTVIFYGDKSNWWSCYALWAFRLFGHENVKILDGGRDKWIAENRPLTREVPSYPRTEYPVPAKRHDDEIRAFYEETLKLRKAKLGAEHLDTLASKVASIVKEARGKVQPVTVSYTNGRCTLATNSQTDAAMPARPAMRIGTPLAADLTCSRIMTTGLLASGGRLACRPAAC
jgi:hypothetical protein